MRDNKRGTIEDPAMDRLYTAPRDRTKDNPPDYPPTERFLVMDDLATIYGEYLTREAADAECAGLVHQGVECWVVRVTRLEA